MENLFARRSHGAANFRGVYYQILYSVFRAFDLYQTENPNASVRLEGIEDLDLRGLYIGDEYVQVKNLKDNFSWSDLKEPFQRFFEVLQLDPNCRFLLICGGPISKGIRNLSHQESLSGKDRTRLNRNIWDLLKSIKISREDGEKLLNNLQVIWKPELEIENELRRFVAARFELGSEVVDVYIATLVARFFKWARDRREVGRADIEVVRAEIGEALARESAFQAYGRGLVTKITWSQTPPTLTSLQENRLELDTSLRT
jgi:hypothetical protein